MSLDRFRDLKNKKIHKRKWKRKKSVRYTSLTTTNQDNNNHRVSKHASTSWRSDGSPSCLVGHHTGGVPVKTHSLTLRWGGCGLHTGTPTHNNEPKKTPHDNNMVAEQVLRDLSVRRSYASVCPWSVQMFLMRAMRSEAVISPMSCPARKHCDSASLGSARTRWSPTTRSWQRDPGGTEQQQFQPSVSTVSIELGIVAGSRRLSGQRDINIRSFEWVHLWLRQWFWVDVNSKSSGLSVGVGTFSRMS